MRELIELIQSCLTDDLLGEAYKASPGSHPTTGHCYVAAEAYWHLTGRTLTPHVIASHVYGVTHWFLKDKNGTIHDPTAEQFDGEVIEYHFGRPCGFLTKTPSKRAAELIRRCKSRNSS